MNLSQAFTYSFPAIRGIQAGREYYIAMCPLKLIPKIFLFDEDEVPPEYRAQRVLNRSRIPSITQYIVDNVTDYVFSSLTASIDGEVTFISSGDSSELGQLVIPMGSRFLINDGQHRRAAIEEALKLRPELGEETISVVFFYDAGLQRSQQMFADLNKHAVNTTRSIGILYDFRDPLSIVTKDVVQSLTFLRHFTDFESPTLAMLSPKLFTLSSIYNTLKNLLRKTKGQNIDSDEVTIAISFWEALSQQVPEWNMIQKRELTASKLRKNYIIGYSVFVEAMGLIGAALYYDFGDKHFSKLSLLTQIDWSKSNRDWIGRAISSAGRITNNIEAIRLTSSYIKSKMDISLDDEDMKYESKFQEEVSSN
ncbi:DNA sulfur modification protein DndB [Paenibacillus cymbidii]|uniref:DNA sulfur modification protein DndB n=1 Tax=Paenibacillus cymbidii TaxID=1639034 RepID=UPI00108214D8|nr:DNA sulfur modification protein DndB [Paenibacillus cymbidii]